MTTTQAVWDTGDGMRERTWDMPPPSTLDALLGALGAAGKDPEFQRAQVREWLQSTAAVPAPHKLYAAARAFAEGGAGGQAGES